MYIFKEAFERHRPDKNIFMGFGLKHLDDVSKYYVSPRNEGGDKTYMAQMIGEGVNLLLDTVQIKRSGIKPEDGRDELTDCETEFSCNPESSDDIWALICPHRKWYEAGIFDEKIRWCEIYTEKYSIEGGGPAPYALKITVGCSDEEARFLPLETLRNHEYIFRLLAITVLAVQFNGQGSDAGDPLARAESYFYKPTVENYVRFCEEFYQSHKKRDYRIEYDKCPAETPGIDFVDMLAPYIMDGSGNKGTPVDRYKDISVNTFDRGEFLSEYVNHIPALPPELVMDKELKPIANAIKSGDCIAFLQHGVSGTGKTINCKLICQAIGLPIMETINCSENLDEFVLGKFIPSKGGIEFTESYVTKAIRHGGAVVFEEINFAKPQYLAFLNSLLDDNGFVRLDNNEVVRRHKNFRFFATLNFGYYGTKELNQALYNRFQIIKRVYRIDDIKIKNMLLTRVPYCEKYVGKMLIVYHKIGNKILMEELDYVISPRNLEAWARLAAHIGFVEAAENTIVQIAKGDIQMESTVRKLVNSFAWE